MPDLHIASTVKAMTRPSAHAVRKSPEAIQIRDDEYDVRRSSPSTAMESEGGFFKDDGVGEDD